MSLQIEGVIEPFATEGAEVSFNLVMALEMTVKHALQAETFTTDVTAINILTECSAGDLKQWTSK